MSLIVGIDLGGTAIKHGLVDSDGRVVAEGSTPTPKGGRTAILDQLAKIVSQYNAKHHVDAVGVGTAGAVDFETGTTKAFSPNIAEWGGTPVRSELLRRTGLPVMVDNDANCMALAELIAGAAKGYRSIFFLTLGTGVGSATVIDGRLWRGAHSMGGEWGHATIVHNGRLCGCGKRGHLEAYASATALVRRTVELARQGLPSMYGGINDDAAAVLGSKEVFAAAAGGDAAAAQAISETAAYLGTGIASAVNLLDPERVVIGGGMAEAGDSFLSMVESEARARSHEGVSEHVKIVAAALANRAGFIGAALLLRDQA